MDTRTLEQNARMWAMCEEISKAVDWYGQKLSKEDWKTMFTAAIRKHRVVPGIDGTSFVVLGDSTRRMTKQEHSELQDLIEAFASERGVQLNIPQEVP